MPRVKDDRAMAEHEDKNQNSAKAIQLPSPTADQVTYLEQIRRAGEDYDPTAIVGRPRHTAD